jgi:RHS repeat-associated protein
MEYGFATLDFGDGPWSTGNSDDAYHFAGFDHDDLSNTDHAQFRQYSPMTGRWMSPGPYSGSYEAGNPQSLNRYAYVRDNPVSSTDPTGLFGEETAYTIYVVAHCGLACVNPAGLIASGVTLGVGLIADLGHTLGLWGNPQFRGSLKPRPATPKTGCSFTSSSIDKYLTDKASPMAGTGNSFMNVGKEFNLDPRLLVSVAGAESRFGARITSGQNNALNVLYGHPRSNSPFNTFESNIHSAGKSIANPSNQYDLTNTSTFYGKYCSGPDCSNGLKNLNTFMKEQGADQNALADPCS